jgi:hypothetical protein
MSRERRIPSHRRHKQSGQAVTTLPDGLGGRRDVLLGRYNSKASRLEYARVLEEWEANGHSPPATAASTDLSVNELVELYWQFVEGYYLKDGKPTSEQGNIKQASPAGESKG